MTYAQLRMLGSVQKHGGGGGWAIEHFQCQTFFDPLHKSQNSLNPLNKSKKKKKNFLKIVLFAARFKFNTCLNVLKL